MTKQEILEYGEKLADIEFKLYEKHDGYVTAINRSKGFASGFPACLEILWPLLVAGKDAHKRLCESHCMTHDVCATSHIYECTELRNAWLDLKQKLEKR